MKIAHAVGWYYPESLGGTEVYVAGLCRRLRHAGHEVCVAVPEAGLDRVSEYLHEGIPVFRYPVPSESTRDEAQGLVAARGAGQFDQWLSRTRPDILHVHSLLTGLGLHELRVARRLGIPIVLTHHLPSLGYICRLGSLMERGVVPCDGMASPRRCASCLLVTRGLSVTAANVLARVPASISSRLGAIPGPIGTGLGMVASIVTDEHRHCELTELVSYQVVLNEAGRQIVLAAGVPEERVVLNRLGIDHRSDLQNPPVARSPTGLPVRLGFLGRIDKTKGVLDLLDAVALLARTAPFTLEIVGPVRSEVDARLKEDLERTIKEDVRVTLRPAVSSAEVPSLLAAFDVLLCPSTGFENGPTVALEAMAVGTPIIASRLGNLAEIVDDGVNGRLVPAGDVKALAAAIQEVVDDPAGTIDRWRTRLGAVRSLDEIADDYLVLYSRLAVRRAQAS